MAENVKERTLRYLVDAYAAEEGGLSGLKDIADETEDVEVRTLLNEHISTTRIQMNRLAIRITELGGDVSPAKGMVNQAISKLSALANLFHDNGDKLTQDLIKAYALEQFEVGMYTSLRAFAEATMDHETAMLAEAIGAEEQLAAERILRLIPSVAKRVAREAITPAAQ